MLWTKPVAAIFVVFVAVPRHFIAVVAPHAVASWVVAVFQIVGTLLATMADFRAVALVAHVNNASDVWSRYHSGSVAQ